VWCEDRKLASIGVGVRHWISLHGFAINVCGSLEPFQAITPCGIAGVEMTSVSQELAREVGIEGFTDALIPILRRRLAELRTSPPLNHEG
jgi:lipoyl(octanoyl) transferase